MLVSTLLTVSPARAVEKAGSNNHMRFTVAEEKQVREAMKGAYTALYKKHYVNGESDRNKSVVSKCSDAGTKLLKENKPAEAEKEFDKAIAALSKKNEKVFVQDPRNGKVCCLSVLLGTS